MNQLYSVTHNPFLSECLLCYETAAHNPNHRSKCSLPRGSSVQEQKEIKVDSKIDMNHNIELIELTTAN